MDTVVNIVGLTLEQMKEKHPGLNYRVVQEDQEFHMITSDYVPDRYNLHIWKGKIIHVTKG